MKLLNTGMQVVLSIFLIISMTGCASSGSTNMANGNISKAENYSTSYWTLEDFLRRANGVQLNGSKSNMRVTIRGPKSINNSDNPPLYIVDGQKAGRNFSQVSSMFSRGEILSVEILPPGASTIYGMEGNYGVIKIKTKTVANRGSQL